MRKLTKLVAGVAVMFTMFSSVQAGVLGEYEEFSKWGGSDGATVTVTQNFKTTGENCALVTIPAGAKYPGISLENKGVFNLSAADTMSFDCYNPGASVNFTLKIKSAGKQFSKIVIIPNGQTKIKIKLTDIPIDLSSVKYLKLWTKRPAKEITLYLDNLQFK